MSEFDEKQIEFMKQNGLDFDFANLSEDEYVEIENVVGDVYTYECQTHETDVTPLMLMCESILDKLV